MKPLLIKTLLTILVFPFTIIHLRAQEQVEKVNIQVNLDEKIGEMDPIWAWWGYDEPNYTYMKDGKKLLSEIASLSPVPVYVRAHSLLVTGEGTHALKWGSTNAYTEDADGNPVYDWTIVDRIFDTYIERGMKPFAQIGFMPEALSSKPEPYRHHWYPGAPYEEIYTGWAYPPNDYKKYGELVYQWVLHCVERYGKEEVDSWYWEVWNEPNIGYWQGTMEEYFMLYDYAADAVKRALPTAKIGGPETTGPGWDKAAEFLTAFLDHVRDDKSYATGKKDIPLDFISFHAKGSPKLVDDMVQMNIGTQLRDISEGFRIVASYPEFKDLPIIIGESDPEGCAACSVNDYPQNDYRNGTMYASYTAAAFSRKYELADHFGVNLLGAVTWGFEFEDQPWYAGFRDMATNGVDKPVLNVFRMFGMMEGDRVKINQDGLAYDFLEVRDHSVREKQDINAIASKSDRSAAVMVWNYHDNNDLTVPDASVSLQIKGVSGKKVLINHYRVDQEHSNSYTLWKKMGSPQAPSNEQIEALEKAGQLELYTSPFWVESKDGTVEIELTIPAQGISLFKLEWK
ncbi:GH39 family glycosyl hydrolase [Algoriphagus machipongonensis]|uniref:Glycosyl hydrolase, family 39 n=1 Tax=Algoriphagus machipongonensis TaxID=388413 RepID=A3I074_9BACT|nr:beta-xylosidase [Algoriphagus machipongonensis]EAZ79870.1 glycosyl hydrolase, family 39 [Algoriphagus machipongonensis]